MKIESAQRAASIGEGISEKGAHNKKLWANRVLETTWHRNSKGPGGGWARRPYCGPQFHPQFYKEFCMGQGAASGRGPGKKIWTGQEKKSRGLIKKI